MHPNARIGMHFEMKTGITSYDIAKAIGINQSTVSRVLSGNDKGMISEATVRKVLAAVEDLGYQPNNLARSLVTGRTNIIGVIMAPYGYTGFTAEVLNRLQRDIEAEGRYYMQVARRGYGTAMFGSQRALHSWPVDGMIFIDIGKSRPDTGKSAGSDATVDIGTYCRTDVDHVIIDPLPGMLEAVSHLIGTGRRNIAFACTGTELPDDATLCAYKYAMAEYGLKERIMELDPFDESDPCTDIRKIHRRSVQSHISQSVCPDSIICISDHSAIGVYRGLLDMGIRVPDDVAIIGNDDIPDGEFLERGLTTMACPFNEMCGLAWQFLQKRIEDPSIPLQSAVLSTTLVVRETTTVSSSA